MKKKSFIKFSLCALFAVSSYAQTSKTYNESFTVNKNAEISLKAKDAEIVIETWNKDRVEVEAILTVENEDEKLAQEILDNFEFEALGNSSKVEIRAGKSDSHFAGLGPDVQFFPMDDIEIFTKGIKGIHIPNLPNISEMDFEFDMEKFNENGKAYIIQFQDEIKEMVNDSTLKKEMKEWKLLIEKELKESGIGDTIKVITSKFNTKPKVISKSFTLPSAQFSGKVNNQMKLKIIIKMPKDANLNLDVKRSQLKVASLYQIDANLNYSGLQIDELMGDNSRIKAVYSNLDIKKADGLNLDLKYAKNINIAEVNNLNSSSKTSNLSIGRINKRALIEGSFGDLNIDVINEDFELIDINLKNSSAKLNLPDVSYTFYINSKSSDFNLDDVLEYKVNTAFDTKIYQNKKAVNSSKVLNIKADFSNFELY